MIELTEIELPSFGAPEEMPALPAAEYETRLSGAVERMARAGLDVLVVYGDREHSANMAFLTGFDPRFEEAVLLLDGRGNRLLIVGNECAGYVPTDGPPLETELFQEFSLMGQPRGDSRPLRAIFADFGIAAGTKVGCVGWKYYADGLVEGGPAAIEIPCYIVDLLRDMTGGRDSVRNAGAIFMDSADGLRITNTAAQIARFEFAAVVVSQGVRALIEHLTEGVSERELARQLYDAGLPHSCHAMVGVGEKVRRGLASASDNVACLGDPFTVAFGLWGALTCRAGAVAAGHYDLPEESAGHFEQLVSNYFEVVVRWYETVGVGVTGGAVFDAVEAVRDDSLFDLAVNPGHSIHLDEWVNSQFFAGSEIALTSGMALQMDIIPVSKGPFWYVNAEDGIALADEALREQIASEHRPCWERIVARQRFMREVLGIAIDDSVLPLSNAPAVLSPYALRPEQALVQVR